MDVSAEAVVAVPGVGRVRVYSLEHGQLHRDPKLFRRRLPRRLHPLRTPFTRLGRAADEPDVLDAA